ncbi:hypothetical protein M3M39_00910 [Fructilactobacillus hinvesii]|uniref:XRE family transcriptional regulator n=1 Tax=Fructilactobacillus hinvesii TaxID=2940300 RepID=A0ABY5BTB3_9LACO|nr:hypothetical protein [Fructilactobacillus hinvesii]USS88079.1 hypothetical protein M3M39_00910 [Fructilactobacillus hinvesii]
MYGETIKKIRLDKGFSLKSVYSDVCSKTNAIKFEKGERILSAEKYYQAKLDFLYVDQAEGKQELLNVIQVAKLLENERLVAEIEAMIA